MKAAGAHLLRGGAYKPRTSPYAFQGLGEEGLRILAAAREETGLPVVTEALDVESVDLVERYADAIQIGARNMQNFSLLKRCGKARKPVLLKRGLSATLEEFLMSAEYILSEGNYEVILCERGVRTFSDFSRNTLDLAVVPAVKGLSHLPILVDPSHGTGRRDKVAPLSRGAAAVGADGLIVEVHHDPDTALSDGPQSITPAMFDALMGELRQIAPVIGRRCRQRTRRARNAAARALRSGGVRGVLRPPCSVQLDHLPLEEAGEDQERLLFAHGAELQDRLHVPLAVDPGEHEALVGVEVLLGEGREVHAQDGHLVEGDGVDEPLALRASMAAMRPFFAFWFRRSRASTSS